MFLLMENIVKTFGPQKALDNVSLKVGRSEIHGLMGENGAGKSTLMNVLGGIFPPNSGKIHFNHQTFESLTTQKANELGIRFIHQELNVVNDLKVYENLFLGEELIDRFRILRKKEMIERSKEIFNRMHIEINPEEKVAHLDTCQKQIVEIAKALLFESNLIIMDEPTTALTNKEIENLFTIMRKLKDQGVSIIYISHKMPELFEICDNYTVLRDGKYIESGRFEDIDEHRATELLVGRTITNSQRKKSNIQDETIIKVQNLSAPPYFFDINFEVKKGEVLAVTGLHGDGRGELSEALFGARKCTEGKVFLNRKELKLKNINNVIRQGVGMVPRNRKERSIIKDMSIRDNLSVAHFVKESKNKLINKKTELSRFYRSQKKTGIKAGSPEDIITSLSGGNQQKVIIARWLEINSDVYILDNPTQGIDVGAKFEVYKLIDLLASEGKSIIIFSAEFPEIYKVADRCLVLYKGKINADLTGEDMTEKNVMYYATGANMEGLKCM